MCLIAFAINARTDWPLVIASNRDEYLTRPTAALARWDKARGPAVFGGRDLLDGGTWLGLSSSGRVGMLTNVRQGQPGRGRLSRGELVSRWLTDNQNGTDFARSLHGDDYGGFNLVIGQVGSSDWHWISNRGSRGQTHDAVSQQLLAPGLYGLSNGRLDEPWPKTLWLKQALQDSLTKLDAPASTEELEERARNQLLDALADRRRADDDSLPDTGVPLDWEKSLSSPFVDDPGKGYGTLCSTVVLARQGAVTMTELSHREEPARRRELAFKLD